MHGVLARCTCTVNTTITIAKSYIATDGSLLLAKDGIYLDSYISGYLPGSNGCHIRNYRTNHLKVIGRASV